MYDICGKAFSNKSLVYSFPMFYPRTNKLIGICFVSSFLILSGQTFRWIKVYRERKSEEVECERERERPLLYQVGNYCSFIIQSTTTACC